LLLIKFLQPKHFLGNFTHFYLANFACHRHWKTVGEVEKFGNFEMRKMLCKKITLLAMHSQEDYLTRNAFTHATRNMLHEKTFCFTRYAQKAKTANATYLCSAPSGCFRRLQRRRGHRACGSRP
jgi:hypothetical protein